METTTSLLKLVTPNMSFSKTDLKDAYYTIPILKEHQKYLKFANKDHLYKFTCLPNDYFHGSRKLTKALKPPLSKLHLNKITIATPCPSAPVTCAPVASPVDYLTEIGSAVPNYTSLANE